MRQILASLYYYYYLVIFRLVQLLKGCAGVICSNRENAVLRYMKNQSIQLNRDHGPDSGRHAQKKKTRMHEIQATI